jgi:hypothetical protein
MNRKQRAGDNLPKALRDLRWDVTAPVQKDTLGEAGQIPQRVARLAYEAYALAGHGGQSFEEINRRGGFGWSEIVALLRGPAHYRSEHFTECFDRCAKEPYKRGQA